MAFKHREQNPNVGKTGGTTKALLAQWPRATGECADRNEQRTALHQRTGRQAGDNSGEFLVGELQMGRFGWAAVIFWSEMLQPWQPCINVGEICMDNAISEKRSLETCRASLHTPDLAEWRPWLS